MANNDIEGKKNTLIRKCKFQTCASVRLVCLFSHLRPKLTLHAGRFALSESLNVTFLAGDRPLGCVHALHQP